MEFTHPAKTGVFWPDFVTIQLLIIRLSGSF